MSASKADGSPCKHLLIEPTVFKVPQSDKVLAYIVVDPANLPPDDMPATTHALDPARTKMLGQKKTTKKKKVEETLPPFMEDTPKGEKKRLKPFDDPYYSSYHPVAVESAWYNWWEQEGFFKPEFTDDGDVKPEGSFVVVVPPPNVTGALQ